MRTWTFSKSPASSILNVVGSASASPSRCWAGQYFLRSEPIRSVGNSHCAFFLSLCPSPWVLFYHFFSVAFFAIYLLFTKPAPGSKLPPSPLQWPALTLRSFGIVRHSSLSLSPETARRQQGVGLPLVPTQIWTACVVFLPVIYSEMRF